MNKPSGNIGKIRGTASESKSIFRSDADQRKAAKNRVLDANALGGDFDISKELETTLGGVQRPLTNDDLVHFRRRVGVVRRRSTLQQMKGGIRVSQIIHLATPSPDAHGNRQKETDIDRAMSQIKMAIPSMANRGKMRFVTNAGGTTPGVTRHHVNVTFVNYPEAVSIPTDKKGSLKTAKWLANEPIKFECDCGRHRYWFRYVASIGGWNEGRIETGYPKIRNPNLMGVACKHMLRVARELQTSRLIHMKIDAMIRNESKAIQTTQKEAERVQKAQKKAPKSIDQARAKREAKKLLGKIGRTLKSKSVERQSSIGKERYNAIEKSFLDRQLAAGFISQDIYNKSLELIKN